MSLLHEYVCVAMHAFAICLVACVHMCMLMCLRLTGFALLKSSSGQRTAAKPKGVLLLLLLLHVLFQCHQTSTA